MASQLECVQQFAEIIFSYPKPALFATHQPSVRAFFNLESGNMF